MLTYLVNDILDLKVIKSGKFTVMQNIFNPKESIMFVLKMFDNQVMGKRINLAFKTVAAKDHLDWKNIKTFR